MKTAVNGLFMRCLAKLSRKPKAKVFLERLQGLVLDVGGGGEGTIAKACGKETVCVDVSKTEINEAKTRGAVANWVLCDARFMPFRNGTFDAATFFFSLMYMKTAEKKLAVLTETRRVLKTDGSLHMWDAAIEERPELFVIFVEANLPDGEKIHTGYGVKGAAEKAQTLEFVSKVALDAGFKVSSTESHKNWFTARFQ